MSFNEDGPEENRNFADGDIDFDRINRVSRKVRFYNRVIIVAIFIIIALGAGCGIYLYNYISSGVRGGVMPSNDPKAGGTVKTGGTLTAGPISGAQTAASDAKIQQPPQPGASAHSVSPGASASAVKHEERTARVVKKQSMTVVHGCDSAEAAVVASAATTEAVTNASTKSHTAAGAVTALLPKSGFTASDDTGGTASVLVPSPQPTEEAALTAPQSSSKTAAAFETPTAVVPAATSEIAAPNAAPKYAADTAKIEKLLAAGRYSDFDNETAAALATPGITSESSSRLNMLLAKRAYYQMNNHKEAKERLLKVKNIAAAGICDYASLYLNLFGSAARSHCAQLISYAAQSAAALTDAEKVELAGTMARNGFYEDARRMLNRVIASSSFESEIGRINEILKRYEGSQEYKAVLKARENFEYSIDYTGSAAGVPVRISRTPLFKFKNSTPVSCFAADTGAGRKLFVYCANAAAYEVDLSVPGRVNEHKLVPPGQGFVLNGVFAIRGAQHAAEFERSSKYQLAPINNAAARARYLPSYFEKKEFENIFILSADGLRLARFIPAAVSDGYASLEIVNIADGKPVFKTDRVFYRPHDVGFACFSADLIKYSIDEKLECRHFYYFKHASAPGATAEAAIKLKLYSFDLEKLEEKPLFTIEINGPQELYLAYAASAGLLILSYQGGRTAAASLRLRSGSWLINRDLTGALFLGDRPFRCASGDFFVKERTIYAFDASRSELAAFVISPCEAAEFMDHAGMVFPYFPDYAFALLEELARSKGGATGPAGARKLEAMLGEKKKELTKIKNAEFLVSMTTLLRMGLPALALEKINGYAKNAQSLTDEESVKILELKKEAEAANDK